MAQPKKLSLKSKGGIEQKFDFTHALRILRHEASTGRINWSINHKDYEFKDNEVIRSTRKTKEAEE